MALFTVCIQAQCQIRLLAKFPEFSFSCPPPAPGPPSLITLRHWVHLLSTHTHTHASDATGWGTERVLFISLLQPAHNLPRKMALMEQAWWRKHHFLWLCSSLALSGALTAGVLYNTGTHSPLCCSVAFTLDADHVHPEETVERLQCYTGHLRVFALCNS